MIVKLNGEPTEVNERMNIYSFLQTYGFKDKIVAVALNGVFIPKSNYDTSMVSENDEIEIVAPMQGG